MSLCIPDATSTPLSLISRNPWNYVTLAEDRLISVKIRIASFQAMRSVWNFSKCRCRIRNLFDPWAARSAETCFIDKCLNIARRWRTLSTPRASMSARNLHRLKILRILFTPESGEVPDVLLFNLWICFVEDIGRIKLWFDYWENFGVYIA